MFLAAGAPHRQAPSRCQVRLHQSGEGLRQAVGGCLDAGEVRGFHAAHPGLQVLAVQHTDDLDDLEVIAGEQVVQGGGAPVGHMVGEEVHEARVFQGHLPGRDVDQAEDNQLEQLERQPRMKSCGSGTCSNTCLVTKASKRPQCSG